MKLELDRIEILKPDDWHVHLREDDTLKAVIQSTMRINSRCIAMPNLNNPITSSEKSKKYTKKIKEAALSKDFTPLIPCYLNENLDLIDFENALINNTFFGAKLYPMNSTTNSNLGISKIENIFPALEILEKFNKPLLIHAEKVKKDISIFDREKYFIDDEFKKIISNFPSLKIVFEHVSSKYGCDFVLETKNIAGTITPHHMLLTKKDVFKNSIDAHHFCMPVVKEESDLVALRKYACSGNKNFFLGTDSAPHNISSKENTKDIKPGIFSAPCSLELYAMIFEEENCLENFESFASINGPNFYKLPINKDKIKLIKKDWELEEFTIYNNIKIKNFFGGKTINWMVDN